MEKVERIDADQWWRSAVIYQVYPRSFSDTNNDGLGDIKGITKRLDYLKKLGVDAIWLSPHYPSPQADAGYDVADYKGVNPDYGTLEDMDELIAQAHERGIKVIIDLVPNHSSSEHEWFKAALKAGHDSPERARYYFRKSPDGPPNNWGSMFGGPAWSKVQPLSGKEEDKDWWYLHLFAPEQPDFDWDNPEVHEMICDVLRFWLDRGIDGFRVDVANGVVKAPGLPDDEMGVDRWSDKYTDEQRNGGPYYDQEGVHEIYREWRQVLDEYGRDRMMVAEAWVNTPARAARYVREDEMSQAFNFYLLKSDWDAAKFREVITETIAEMGKVGAPVTWVLSNHDVVRHATRFGYDPQISTAKGIGATDPQPDRQLGLQRALAATTFMMGLPGSAYVYQGEELGLPEVTDMPDEARQDPMWLRSSHTMRGRDGCRVPLPWEADAPNCGFGTGKPWLPQPSYWASYAADRQETDPDSTLNFYRHLLALRKELQLGSGSFQWDDALASGKEVLAYSNGATSIILNMGHQAAEIPTGKKQVFASGPVEVDGTKVTLPGNTCVWLQ